MEAELYKIFIYPKNKKDSNVLILSNIDGYYCTDKMFYAHEKSDITHYYSLDSIEEVMARPMNMKNKEEV